MKTTVNRRDKKDSDEMSLSESINPGQSRLLDEVRAKIFYLASDVEPASRSAAVLLRAVAESIVEAPESEMLSRYATLRSAAASIRLRGDETRAAPSDMRGSLPPLGQDVGVANSRSGQKR